MKPKSRILSLLLAICLVVGLMPTAAFAADGDKTIMLGTSGIKGPTESTDSNGKYYTPNSYIYFGKNGETPIKWRVLDADKANDRATSGMFLLSEHLIASNVQFESAWGSDDGDGQTNPNAWQYSDAQKWCSTFATNSSNFSLTEQGAMLGVAKTDNGESNLYTYPYSWSASSLTSNDKMFFLSVRELADYVGSYNEAPGLAAKSVDGTSAKWWLRSPDASYKDQAGAVFPISSVGYCRVEFGQATRPAFNLDLTSVLFTSAAANGKPEGLNKIGNYNGNEWKLTLLDNSRNFAVTETTASGKPGDTVTLNYTGATTGTNEYISVILADKNGTQYYGRVAKPDAESGTVNVTIPTGLTDGTYTLNVFSEQYNGDYKTDYASAFDKVTLTVNSGDTTKSTLSNGSSTRQSDTTATVKFTSNEAGEYYYAVVDSGAAEPNITTTWKGTPCNTSEQTIPLTSLSGAGAKDIYIVVKDAAGNVSNKLKIEIPAYVAPNYSISASPAALNFGSKTVGYTEAPATQTVTLTNTGNQAVTVTLPSSTNYTITAGEGFRGNSATLVADSGTATFTVQLNTGLGVGNYSEKLTISGSNGASAQVALSFSVVEATPDTHTLTVDLNGGSGSTTGGAYAKGAVINIDAGSRSNYRFDGWTSSNGGSFADASSASTTFTMPAADTTVTANWRYIGGGGSTTDYYRLTFETNGGSEIAFIRRAEYSTIDLSNYKPTREGYEFTGWYADKDLTEKITSIRLTRNTTVYAGWEENPSTGFENPFTDVSENDWFFGDVKFVYQNGLMNGTSETTFSPDGTTSRGMIVTILWRMAGSPDMEDEILGYPFQDVDANAYYATAVYWARLNGIADGYGDNTFGPNDPITREQMAVMLYRYAQHKDYDTTQGGMAIREYADYGQISSYALEAMDWANATGIVTGTSERILSPQGQATRAQAAAMLMRFCEQYAEK